MACTGMACRAPPAHLCGPLPQLLQRRLPLELRSGALCVRSREGWSRRDPKVGDLQALPARAPADGRTINPPPPSSPFNKARAHPTTASGRAPRWPGSAGSGSTSRRAPPAPPRRQPRRRPGGTAAPVRNHSKLESRCGRWQAGGFAGLHSHAGSLPKWLSSGRSQAPVKTPAWHRRSTRLEQIGQRGLVVEQLVGGDRVQGARQVALQAGQHPLAPHLRGARDGALGCCL